MKTVRSSVKLLLFVSAVFFRVKLYFELFATFVSLTFKNRKLRNISNPQRNVDFSIVLTGIEQRYLKY